MAQREVVVTGGVRTAIGGYGGSLRDIPPTKLGALAIREAVARAKVDPATVGHVVLGSGIHGDARDMYISRVATIEGGLPVVTPSLTVHRPSRRRAAKAIDAGHFRSQIVPVEVKSKKGPAQFDVDEHVRRDATLADLQKLKTVFKKDGTVTAGNASGINDAAAAVVLMEKSAAQKQGSKPLARLVAYAHAGVEPQLMGLGPIPAVKRVFEKAGLKPADMDVIESNEAFAVQAMAVTRDLGLDPAKVNPNGGAVARGHPIGATGCILTVKAIYELHRTGKRYALVTMCIGGGQGIAAIFERM